MVLSEGFIVSTKVRSEGFVVSTIVILEGFIVFTTIIKEGYNQRGTFLYPYFRDRIKNPIEALLVKFNYHLIRVLSDQARRQMQ